jgi:hypothetical protein
MKTSTEYNEGYRLGVEDCEYAIKLGYSALVQHLKHWEGCPSQDDEDKENILGYLQALKDFEDKLFSTTEW